VSASPTAISRCDSATYVNGSKCVFPRVASVLEFSASDTAISDSSQFIRDAQTDITRTKPGTPGKRVPGIPGIPGDSPLHRLYSAYDVKTDIKASRRRVPKTCRTYWGPKYTLGGTRQCDEYPFATTYENSARINTHTVFAYAVRTIKKEHNETAGRATARGWVSTTSSTATRSTSASHRDQPRSPAALDGAPLRSRIPSRRKGSPGCRRW